MDEEKLKSINKSTKSPREIGGFFICSHTMTTK